jgi:uncharacterized protein (UPF0335 family)
MQQDVQNGTGESATLHNTTRQQLKSIVERIERLEEERKALGNDIKDIYSEAKATGFDTKALRKLIRIRKQDSNEYREEEALLETYMSALGMLPAS